MSPEAAAREKIDAHLVAAGWVVQDDRTLNPSAARGIALRRFRSSPAAARAILPPLGIIVADLETALDQFSVIEGALKE